MFAVEYVFLGAWIGIISCLVGATRSIVYYAFDKHNAKMDWLIPFCFSAVLIACGFLTYQDGFSLLPMIGTTAYTWALWQSNLSIFRKVAAIEPAMMLIYDYHVGARIALLATLLELVGAIVAIIRLDILHKKEKVME